MKNKIYSRHSRLCLHFCALKCYFRLKSPPKVMNIENDSLVNDYKINVYPCSHEKGPNHLSAEYRKIWNVT